MTRVLLMFNRPTWPVVLLARLTTLTTLATLLAVAAGPLAEVRPAGAAPYESVTARLGISAGKAIEGAPDAPDAPLGLDGRELRARIPVLYETADRLDVRIQTVSVGQGFFAGDGGLLLSEKDLDLVVHGRRDRITTMAAVLGKTFEQSVVFVWFFDRDANGGQATATVPLPGGAEALTTDIYKQLVTELSDGGHVRYAGRRSLLFVANTGDDPDSAFLARIERARALLNQAGVRAGPIQCERAQFVSIDSTQYDQIIAGRQLPQGAPVAVGAAGRDRRPDRRCAA
jgi:hypothetical protein